MFCMIVHRERRWRARGYGIAAASSDCSTRIAIGAMDHCSSAGNDSCSGVLTRDFWDVLLVFCANNGSFLHVVPYTVHSSSLSEANCMAQGACDGTGAMGPDYTASGGFNGVGPDGAQHWCYNRSARTYGELHRSCIHASHSMSRVHLCISGRRNS